MKKKTRAKGRRSEELNLIIRKAALTVSENASIEKLATEARVSGEAIRSAIRLGRFSVGLASALEITVGREHIKREDLCPELAKK